jgi:hypothetical protein
MYAHFKHSQFRRYIIAFGSLFTSLIVTRDDSSGAELQRIVVPIDYGPKERWLYRLVQDPNLEQSVSQVLPRFSFELTGVNYDSGRKMNTLNTMAFPTTDQSKLSRMYTGVPYNLNFDLTLLTKFQSDGFQVTEQILPYFTPEITFAMKPVPELGLIDQVPLALTAVSHSDNYEGEFETRRAILWTFNFTMKVYFYGPRKSQSRIEEVLVDIYNPPFDVDLDPQQILTTEDGAMLLDETGTAALEPEASPDFYGETGRVARVEVDADEAGNVTTTITESDGDVVRVRDFTDEQL